MQNPQLFAFLTCTGHMELANTALISNIHIRTGRVLTHLKNLKLLFSNFASVSCFQQLMQWLVQILDFRSVIDIICRCRDETQVTFVSTLTVLSRRAYLVARWLAALLLIFSGRCRWCLMTGYQTVSPQTPARKQWKFQSANVPKCDVNDARWIYTLRTDLLLLSSAIITGFLR